MHNEEKIIDSTKIAHIFNDYFTNVGSDLAKHIQSNINPLSYINTTLYSISIPQFTEGEILNVIKSLKIPVLGMISGLLKLVKISTFILKTINLHY